MLSDILYGQQSLIDNLFYLRTIREFCVNIELSFYSNNKNYSEVANNFKTGCEELGAIAIELADNKIPTRVFESGSFVSNYTLDTELLTEKLFDINLNTDLTIKEMNLNTTDNLSDFTNDELERISELNNNSINLAQNFIDFCNDILTELRKSNLFSYSYPLFYNYMIEETTLYMNDLKRIQNKTNADPTFVTSYEYWYSNSMMQACKFIIGLSDPAQETLILNADNYRKIFSKQMDAYKDVSSPEKEKVLNNETIEHMKNFISFLSKLIERILNSELYFIVEPLFFDNLLTEANYFLYLLKGANYGIKK